MKIRKIVYLVREALHLYPPCISQILMLNDSGVEVTVICGDCDIKILKVFKERNIKYHIVGNKRVGGKVIGKIYSYIKFRMNAVNLLKKNNMDNTVIWFGTADSAIALTGIHRKFKFVLSVLELYDKYPFYLRGLSRIINDALIVIAAEETRAKIMKVWWNLKERPYVMPNKPYYTNVMFEIEPSEEIKHAISKIDGRKVILYQGIISKDRDLLTLAQALNSMNTDYYLVLIGKILFNSVEQIKEVYSKTIYLGYFPAPQHLQITKYATIGVAIYDDTSLNNLFCAPNKIYEYAYYGKPILCSDVPGLKNTVVTLGAGVCVDFSNQQSIIEGIATIEDNYRDYASNSRAFFDKTDNHPVLEEIVNKIFR